MDRQLTSRTKSRGGNDLLFIGNSSESTTITLKKSITNFLDGCKVNDWSFWAVGGGVPSGVTIKQSSFGVDGSLRFKFVNGKSVALKECKISDVINAGIQSGRLWYR